MMIVGEMAGEGGMEEGGWESRTERRAEIRM